MNMVMYRSSMEVEVLFAGNCDVRKISRITCKNLHTRGSS